MKRILAPLCLLALLAFLCLLTMHVGGPSYDPDTAETGDTSPQVEALGEDVILDPGMGFGFSQKEAVKIASAEDYGQNPFNTQVWWPDNDRDGYGTTSGDLIIATWDAMKDSGRIQNWANNCLDSDDDNRDAHPADPYEGDFHLNCGFYPSTCLLGTIELEEVEIGEENCGHEEWLIFEDMDGDGCGNLDKPLCWDQEWDLPPGYSGNDRDWDDTIPGCHLPGMNDQTPE